MDSGPIALSTVLDSGVPDGRTDYTVVLIHGLMWHGANFKKLLPLAAGNGVRIIAANRRDYPGSIPYTRYEQARLERLATASGSGSFESADARADAVDFIRERGREVYDYLIDLVKWEAIPPAKAEGSGIVLVRWSLGTIWAMTFLAHAPSFQSDIQLSKWVRRVVLYRYAWVFMFARNLRTEPSSLMLALPSPAATYYPPHDESIPFAERLDAFHRWIAQDFDHGGPITAETLALREGMKEPSSTLDRVGEDELAEVVHNGPGDLISGSDTLTVKICLVHGLYSVIKDGILYSPSTQHGLGNGPNTWQDVEIRLVWCDRSIWAMVWAPLGVAEELKQVREAGRSTRNISFVRLRGANHLAHWDLPEKILRVSLGDEEEV